METIELEAKNGCQIRYLKVADNTNGRGRSNAYIASESIDVGADIFQRGLCLPSDNKMTEEQQDVVIDVIHRCFK